MKVNNNKLIVHKFIDDLYCAKFFVVHNCSVDDFYKFIEKEAGIAADRAGDIQPWNALFEGMEVNGEIFCFIYLSAKYDGLSGLSHELIHAAVSVFEIRGIPINRECDEAFAWYYDRVLTTLYAKLEPYIKDGNLRN